MEIISQILSFCLHVDEHMGSLINEYGLAIYIILFAIIFIETGLVVMPFLPGDSLLFILGAFAATQHLNIFILWPLLIAAAIIGDAVNYHIGALFKNKILHHQRIPFIKQAYIDQTQKFYDKYGKKTIILARFVPIVRTFAPFMAGVGNMPYRIFALYNVVGAILWVTVGLGCGLLFGNLPWVKNHFSEVILGIIILSIIPMIYEMIKAKQLK